MRGTLLLLFVVGLTLPATAHAGDAAVYGSDLGRQIDEALQRSTQGAFWGAVLVARGGKIDLAKGYGYADYAQTPITPDTVFEIASVTKQVTATAVLRLAQQGKLKLEDTLATWFAGVPEDKRTIQVRHLLTHTSGLSDRVGVPYGSPLPRAAYVAHILAAPAVAEPGEAFAYNNAGYALLAAVIEEVSGVSYEAYCHKHLFKPAGLKRTGFLGDPKLLKDGNVARRLGDGPAEWSAVNWHRYGFGYKGMGGVVSTLLDMLRWDRALRSDALLDAKHREILYTPALQGYACGWQVTRTARGTTQVHHSGGVQGFGAWFARYLEEDATIVVLTNQRPDFGEVVKTVEEMLFPRPRVTAHVDATGLELSRFNAFEASEGWAWQVERGPGGRELRLNRGERTALRMHLPAGFEQKVAAGLREAIAARRRDDDGGAAAMEGGVYLNAYGGQRVLDLDEQLDVTILPQYVGRGPQGEIVDRRVVFVLNDGKVRNWPVMVKMNVAAAEALLALLD